MQMTKKALSGLAAGLVLAAGLALTVPASAQAPAKPAAPAARAGQPQQPQDNKVELKPSQPDWTKVCGKDDVAKKEICYTTRDFGQDANSPPVLALAVYDVRGDETKIVRLLMPVGLLLEPGFRFSIDKGATQEGAFQICFPNGCFAESKVKVATINQLKKGKVLNVYVKNQVNNEVHFLIPLEGFGKAFDGKAIDPQELAKQQQALQEQLQKRAEEERKRLEAAGQGGAAPAAPAAPTQK